MMALRIPLEFNPYLTACAETTGKDGCIAETRLAYE
jgi:hypothetical protein